MKNIYLTIACAVCLSAGLPVLGQPARQRAERLIIQGASVEYSGDSIRIGFQVIVPPRTVASDYCLMLTPTLKGTTCEQALPAIRVFGRRYQLSEERARLGRQPITPTGTMLTNGDTLLYRTALPVDAALEGSYLIVDRDLEGCCSALTLPELNLGATVRLPVAEPVPPADMLPVPVEDPTPAESSAATELPRRYGFMRSADELASLPVPPVNGEFIAPADRAALETWLRELDIHRGSLGVEFRQGWRTIDPAYKDNAAALSQLAEALNAVDTTSGLRVTTVVIVGYASPEGLLTANDTLAWRRAHSLASYVRDHSTLDDACIRVYNGSEDWQGLRRMIVDSDIPSKSDVLRIIDTVPVEHGREGQLMRLDGGVPYKYMYEHFFPALRQAAYVRVYYHKGEAPTR